MPRPPTPGKRCAVDGCKAWAVRGETYCDPHLRQYQDNLRLGVPDPTPHLVGDMRRLCRTRSCKRLAIANSRYCRIHTQQIKDSEEASALIAAQFTELVRQLCTASADCLAALQRELDMLTAARKILVAHAEMSSRAGWKAISSMTFIRLWLASTDKANDLIKSRFVMENASGSDIDGLLAGVYKRIERQELAVQQPLLGLAPPSASPSDSTPDRAVPLASPEDRLVEWLLEANCALGTRTVLLIAQACGDSSPDGQAPGGGLCAVASALPDRRVDQPPNPADLADRLGTLADTMQQKPDLDRVRQILASRVQTDA